MDHLHSWYRVQQVNHGLRSLCFRKSNVVFNPSYKSFLMVYLCLSIFPWTVFISVSQGCLASVRPFSRPCLPLTWPKLITVASLVSVRSILGGPTYVGGDSVQAFIAVWIPQTVLEGWICFPPHHWFSYLYLLPVGGRLMCQFKKFSNSKLLWVQGVENRFRYRTLCNRLVSWKQMYQVGIWGGFSQ